MWYAMKRLSLGFSLIVLAGVVLLAADKNRVARQSPSDLPRVAIFQFASREILDDAVRGAVEGLKEKGYIDGQTISIRYYNAENDLPTANGIAKSIIDDRPKIVITMSTPCMQVMAAANKAGTVQHVFGTVTDPAGSGVGISKTDPKGHPRHLVGIGTFQPVVEALRIAKAMNPGLRTVGEVWNPGEACSEACTVLARAECKRLGITLLEAQVDSSSGVQEAAESLTARGVQALWVGGDNTVEMSVPSLVKAARKARIPLFANAPTHAQTGALFGLGADYIEVGRTTGKLAGDLMDGLDPASVAITNVVPQQLAINLSVLRGLRDTWQVSDAYRKQAAIIYDDKGVKVKAPAAATGQRAVTKKWRIHLIKYSDDTNSDDVQEGFQAALGKLGLVKGKDYVLTTGCAQHDMATLISLVDKARTDADLVFCISTPTLQAAIKRVGTLPIVFSNVGDPVVAGAGKSFTDHLPKVTGISTMSDFDGMITAVKTCLPQARRIGTLFTPAEVNSVAYKDRLEQCCRRNGLALITVPVTSSAEVSDAAEALVAKRPDAICQISDNTINAGFSGISAVAERSRTPLFSFIRQCAESEGAAIAVSRDYDQAGSDAAALAARIMRGEPPAHIAFRLVSKTTRTINLRNAGIYRLTIPPALVRTADKVVK